MDREGWARSSSSKAPDSGWSSRSVGLPRQASVTTLTRDKTVAYSGVLRTFKPVDRLPKFNKFIPPLDSSGTHTIADVIGHEGEESTSTETTYSTPDKGRPPPVSMSPHWEFATFAGPSTMPLPRARAPESGHHSSYTPTRPSDVGPSRHGQDYADPLFTPPKGYGLSLFTPPSSPLSPFSSPEPCVGMSDHEDDTAISFADETQVVKGKEEENKQVLQVYVLIPRLSEAERKTYSYRDEESLGSMPLYLPDPRCSCSTSPRCYPSFSSGTSCSSSSYLHPQRKTKFVQTEERQSKTMEYEFYAKDRQRETAGPSTSEAGLPNNLTPASIPEVIPDPGVTPNITKSQKRSEAVDIPIPPHKRVRTASPPRVSRRPPSDLPTRHDALIYPKSASERRKFPCDRCIAAGARCTWNGAKGSKKKRGPNRKSCDRCIKGKRCCVVDTSPKPERQGRNPLELDIEDEYFELVETSSPALGVNNGKGKAKAANDEDDDNVDLAGRKNRAREGGAEKVRTKGVAHSRFGNDQCYEEERKRDCEEEATVLELLLSSGMEDEV